MSASGSMPMIVFVVRPFIGIGVACCGNRFSFCSVANRTSINFYAWFCTSRFSRYFSAIPSMFGFIFYFFIVSAGSCMPMVSFIISPFFRVSVTCCRNYNCCNFFTAVFICKILSATFTRPIFDIAIFGAGCRLCGMMRHIMRMRFTCGKSYGT